jgi:hypothetical protein
VADAQNQTTPSRGYYRNGLIAWRADLLKRLRLLMARHARMEKMDHPNLRDQGYLIEITQEMIGIIDRSLWPLEPRP